MLANAKGITLLAPSNAAFAQFIEDPANQATASDSSTLMGLLQYHVLNGTIPASNFTTSMQFIPTMLGANNSKTISGIATNMNKMSSVTGGQVVGGVRMGEKVVITSGLKSMSVVQTAVSYPSSTPQPL